MEQRDLQLLLQRRYLPADRRLAHAQRLTGMGEAAGLGGGMKDSELVPVHGGLCFVTDGDAAGRSFIRRPWPALYLSQIALGLKCCHTAHARGRHGLAEHFVLDVAGGEHARDGRAGRIGRGDADSPTRFISSWPLKSSVAGTWPMAMNTPSTCSGETLPVLTFCSRTPVTRLGIVRAHHLLQHRVPDHLDLGILEQALLHDALGAEAVAPVHEGHLAGEVGQKQRFLDGGVAAADDNHFLALVEETVAGGAGRHAVALELLLRRQAEPARLGAGGDDERVAGVGVAGIALEPERAPTRGPP